MISCRKKIAKMKLLICKLWAKEKFNFLEHHKKKIGYPIGSVLTGIYIIVHINIRKIITALRS